jgi:hypothetical protein
MLEPEPVDRPSAADVESQIRKHQQSAAAFAAGKTQRKAFVGALLLALTTATWMTIAAYQAGRRSARTEAAEVFFNLRALDRDVVRLQLQDPQSDAAREAAIRRADRRAAEPARIPRQAAPSCWGDPRQPGQFIGVALFISELTT